MQPPIILFLSSTSFHFPLDLHGILANEGAETKRHESIDDFLSTPDRHTPYVAVLEIGSTEDVDRALLAYEWCEQIQPIAPCRTILLIASKNIQLGDRAARFGNAEVAHLPLPLKNLLFKIDLQKRLLVADQAQAAAARGKEAVASSFSASFVEKPPKLDRVLLIRGPGPKKGYWQEAAESPSGKIRWRWVSTQKPEDQTPAEKAGVTWAADSRVKPVYEEETESWAIADPEADLIGFRKDKVIFSARTSNRLPPVERVVEEKREFGAEKKSAPEADRAFAEEKNSLGGTTVDAKQTASAGAGAQTIARAEEKPASAAEKISRAAAAAATAQKIQSTSAPVESEQKLQSSAGKAVASVTSAASAPSPTPEWKEHAAPKAVARPIVDRTHKMAEEAQAAAAAKDARAPDQPEAEALPAAEDSIPEHVQEEEPEDHAGYSVPVSSEVERQTGEIARPPAAEAAAGAAATHPRKEAEYSSAPEAKRAEEMTEESITEIKARRRAEAEAAAAAKAKRAAAEQEAAAKAMARPEEVVAAALEKLAAQRKKFLDQQAPVVKPAPVPAPQAPAPLTPAADVPVPAAEPTRTEEVTRTAGQMSVPAKEEIKIKGEPVPEQIQTEVALEGTPEHSGEEIRIRARAEGDSSHRERAAKAPSENPLKLRHFVTMTLQELSDRDSSWHPMHRYRIYLSANHRYYGVKDPAALLPLWVYEGELAPEFLEDKRAWKFYDRYPELYSTLDTLPPVVLDQIHVMAGKPLPGASSGAVGRAAAGVTEGTVAGPASAADSAPEAQGKGLWGSVKSFFRRIFGG